MERDSPWNMGQGGSCCDANASGHRRSNGDSGPTRGTSQSSLALAAEVECLTPTSAERRIERLNSELRALKDQNFQIREEHNVLRRQLQSDGRARGASAAQNSRVDLEQTLAYTRELIRSVQAENARLAQIIQRGGVGAAPAGGAGGVSLAQFELLKHRRAQLQQGHLQAMQAAQQLKGTRGGYDSLNGSMRSHGSTSYGGGSTGSSGTPGASPIYRLGSFDVRSVEVDPQLAQLQAQLQTLMREHEDLRGKVRKLAQAN